MTSAAPFGHRTKHARRLGLTMIEVLIALAIFGTVLTVLSAALVKNVQQTTVSGQRTQAAQVLNYLGRRVVGGDNAVLPNANAELRWEYGELAQAFPDLRDEGGFSNPASYRVVIRNLGTITLATSSATQYRLDVCFVQGEGEQCIPATTVGPAPAAPGNNPLLPGIN